MHVHRIHIYSMSLTVEIAFLTRKRFLSEYVLLLVYQGSLVAEGMAGGGVERGGGFTNRTEQRLV